MAYKTKSRARKAAPRKRVYRKKRTTRKRTTKRTTAKRISNIAATKKSNQVTGAVTGTSAPASVAFVTMPVDGKNRMLVWTPSYLQGVDRKSQILRNTTTIYMKGVAETVDYGINSGYAVLHRRIIIDWDQRWDRGVQAFTTNVYRNLDISEVETSLFRGNYGDDWTDAIRAPLDRTKFNVKSDRMYTYNPPNEKGMERFKKTWIPINKNITYNDKEVADGTTWDAWPNDNASKYYIIDIFRSHGDSTTDPAGEQYFTFGCNSTIYWHEK